MATPYLTEEQAKERIEHVNRALREGYRPPGKTGVGVGAVQRAADESGIARSTMQNTLVRAKKLYGLEPDWSLWSESTIAADRPAIYGPDIDYHEVIRKALQRGAKSAEELGAIAGIPPSLAKAVVSDLHHEGFAVSDQGEKFAIEAAPPPAFIHGPALEIESDKNHRFRIGVISDTHLCSKYCRLDVLNWEYERFKDAGCTHILHAGNWIDGEARFNKHDLLVHGMDAQIRYMAEHYPTIKGVHTYAIAGDDHEGWYAQREGVDIGRYAEQIMRDEGRDDWHDLGYMESHVALVNKKTGRVGVGAVVHPGGGSAYADSYAIQKIIEVLEGGEKPAFAIYGHYHKMMAGEYRNVWWLQPGCTQDSTPFARKKKLRFALGGAVVDLEQDPETGAIVAFKPDMKRYFNRGYYQGRWDMARPVKQAAVV